MDTRPISEFFDRENCCKPAEQAKKLRSGPAGVSKVFLRLLEEAGVSGRSVLELGCGTGALSVELLRLGASRVTGLDLSSGSIQVARRRAEESGLNGRLRFEVGDGATAALDRHDVVISDKVMCCYPDASGFLANSLPAAAAAYGFVVPSSKGGWGLVNRGVTALENLWFRLSRNPFRTYLPHLEAVDATVRASGFQPVGTARRWSWHVAVYARNVAAA